MFIQGKTHAVPWTSEQTPSSSPITAVGVLYPYFDTKFIHDSYSCRVGKGTHRALYRFESFSRRVSKNYTKQCWVLKCDIRKFFASIDHDILCRILEKHILDRDILCLLLNVINSFNSGIAGKGVTTW